eukprot:SAG31_NODE_27_length_32731_cov_1443.130393_6_plen_141_part_00
MSESSGNNGTFFHPVARQTASRLVAARCEQIRVRTEACSLRLARRFYVRTITNDVLAFISSRVNLWRSLNSEDVNDNILRRDLQMFLLQQRCRVFQCFSTMCEGQLRFVRKVFARPSCRVQHTLECSNSGQRWGQQTEHD